MTSQKQIDANRRNAQFSTGPKTDEGKANSRRNALRDGLSSQTTTLSDPERLAFDQLKAEMLADFNPQTSLERKLAAAIAWDTWRLDRLRAIENTFYNLGRLEAAPGNSAPDPAVPDLSDLAFADAGTFRSEAAPLELMSLYEARMTRNIHRNVALLRDLQAERNRKYAQDRKEEIRIARLCEFNDMPIRTSRQPSQNGFLFSNEDIARAAVRDRYADAAAHLLSHTPPKNLYGGLLLGVGDTLLAKKDSAPGQQFHHEQSPELLAIDRLNNPKDYGVRPS